MAHSINATRWSPLSSVHLEYEVHLKYSNTTQLNHYFCKIYWFQGQDDFANKRARNAVCWKKMVSVRNTLSSSYLSSYSFNVRDPKTHTVFQASALARVGPPVIFLQAQRSCAISSFIPIAFMSLLTQLLHVFLGAPLSTTPITFILVHFFTQLFSSFRSTCPNHLNLPLCILFSTHSMPKRFKSSSLRFLSFKDTPHIPSYHHPLGPPQPSQVLRFYSPSLATIYQHSLYTGIIYFSLQFQRDTPFCQHWR